jgi:hypothetical protein
MRFEQVLDDDNQIDGTLDGWLFRDIFPNYSKQRLRTKRHAESSVGFGEPRQYRNAEYFPQRH